MAGMTLAEAEEMLALYVAAEKKILTGQSYTIGGTTFTRADLRTVVSERKELQRQIAQLSGGTNVVRKIRVYGGTPA